MKIYPEQDANFYVEKIPCWDSYRRTTNVWKTSDTFFRPKEMCYWRDPDAFKKTEIKTNDLYFKDWPKSRIRNQACLGMLYGTGFRFIKITKKPPAGFKCAPLPVNLEMAYKVNGECNKSDIQISICLNWYFYKI